MPRDACSRQLYLIGKQTSSNQEQSNRIVRGRSKKDNVSKAQENQGFSSNLDLRVHFWNL